MTAQSPPPSALILPVAVAGYCGELVPMPNFFRMRHVLVLLSLLLLPSCTSRYERDFEKAVTAQVIPPTSVEGPWRGEWKSEMNGHQGPLWCVVTETAPGAYDFRYRAGWGKWQFGDYVHQVSAKPSRDGSLSYQGKMDLPGGVGVHEVDGRLTASTFNARYQSERGDRGSMILRRPE